ncbi:hypothetical protein V1478_002334 [Vespula squamosa]|uniref:Uncharacterized protein n=1 Tax=Vespula squamosa TaxID=30214 RepID=A0ABD2BW06_VESSQ
MDLFTSGFFDLYDTKHCLNRKVDILSDGWVSAVVYYIYFSLFYFVSENQSCDFVLFSLCTSNYSTDQHCNISRNNIRHISMEDILWKRIIEKLRARGEAITRVTLACVLGNTQDGFGNIPTELTSSVQDVVVEISLVIVNNATWPVYLEIRKMDLVTSGFFIPTR